MSSNKYLIADKSKLLTAKFEKISKRLQDSLSSNTLQTQEQFMLEAMKILQEFYATLKDPILTEYDTKIVHEDDLPDLEVFNLVWQKIIDDLTAIFTELENTEQLTLANFNFITTEANRLTTRLKKVSSLLGDFILYTNNPTKDSIYFKDSFNDLSKLDPLSALLNEEECNINQAEGIVTLPIDKEQDATITIKENPIVNSNSNGVAGNNQEIGKDYHGNIKDILDNNPDTWFEYERITTTLDEGTEPLTLDMTVNLGTEQIVNYVRINPNNFGTKTVVKIKEIETSLNGKVYTSVKDDIPIGDFTYEDEENVFTLAPSSSKYAGQGIYTFTPRKAKYIRFVFTQDEPYVIDTTVGARLRYGIGIRDIELKNIKYKPKGEVVSSTFSLLDEVRKVSIESNQNPSQPSELASITWQVSPDNGSTWHEIQPIDYPGRSGQETTPELLEFNGPSEDTITTAVPVNSLRIKAILNRTDEAFTEKSSTLQQDQVLANEIYQIPSSSPFVISLENPPIDGTIVVIDPLYGSRGIPESPYIFGPAGREETKFRLPYKNFPRPMKKVEVATNNYKTVASPVTDYMHVEIAGEEWTQASGLLSTFSADYDSSTVYRLFNFNPANGVIEFGNGINTYKPDTDAELSIYFDAERVYPSEDKDHIAELEFATSNNKNDMTIKRYGTIKDATEILARKATILRLKNQEITDYTALTTKINSMLLALTGTTGEEQSFLNGKDELIQDYHWSIDTKEGLLYLSTETPNYENVTISYKYQPITVLTTDDWEWGTNNLLKNTIKIKKSAWIVEDIEDEEIASISGTNVFDVANLGVVKGSVSFTLTDSITGTIANSYNNYPFVKEVDFIDGILELGSQTTQTTEWIKREFAGLQTFTLKENILEGSEADVLFSKPDLFSNRQVTAATVNSPGDYHIETNPSDPNYGTVTVDFRYDQAVPGLITYSYSTPTYSTKGLYSVDYKNGKVYTQRSFEGDWTLTVSYSYSDYRAEYRIARILNPESYDIDIVNATITIKDNEILYKELLPRNKNNYYIVNYEYVGKTRDSAEELKDSFTPVIKDYVLRVIPKGKIF